MAHATELGRTSSASNFPDYFSAEAPTLVVQESLDLPDDFEEVHVATLRERMTRVLADTAIAGKLDEMSDTAAWLVEEVATEAASNGSRGDRKLLDAGYGVTPDHKFVEFFSDSEPGWDFDSSRQSFGRGLELLRRAGVQFSYVQEPDSKTIFFTIDPDATAPESDEPLFDFDAIEPI
jgi:hypothetical protein